LSCDDGHLELLIHIKIVNIVRDHPKILHIQFRDSIKFVAFDELYDNESDFEYEQSEKVNNMFITNFNQEIEWEESQNSNNQLICEHFYFALLNAQI
jgi:hypothetical protein